MKRVGLIWLLLFSGFAGLSYELLWVRQLTFTLGNTTESFATVLAVFFGGLALGSRWAGRRSRTSKRPVAAYAALEFATGGLGLLLLPLMPRISAALVAFEPSSPTGATVFRALISGLLLLPPTFLMGATLPFICSATIARDEETGRGVSLVYGINTLGAVLGAYALTYWLLPGLGLTGSTVLVVLINFGVGLYAWLSSRRPEGDGPAAGPLDESASVPANAFDKRALALGLTAGLMGFCATGAQLVWGRFFAIALKGTAYGIGAVLVSVLSGIALGSLIAARVARQQRRAALGASLGQLLFVVGLAGFGLSVVVVNYVLLVVLNLQLAPSVQVHLQLLVVFVVLLVPTVAAGAGLPLLIATAGRTAREAGAVLARLYSINTTGCIVGSLLVGFVVLPELGTNQTLFVLITIAALALAIFNLFVVTERKTLAAALTALAFVGVWAYPGFDARLIMIGDLGTKEDPVTFLRSRQKNAERVDYFAEGASATVMVTRQSDDSLSLSLNGLTQGTVAAVAPRVRLESMLVAAIPLVHATHTRRGLLIGLGTGGTARVLARAGVEQLEVLELEKNVPEAVDLMWGEASPLKDPHLKLIVNDARHHLLLAASKGAEKYDFITSMPAHPWVSASLFTTEFFELVSQNLGPAGVFSSWFGPMGMSQAAIDGLLGSFSKQFPHAIVYWVGEVGAYYLVGSKAPLVMDFGRFQQVTSGQMFNDETPELRTPYFLLSRVVATNFGNPPATTSGLSTDDNGLLEFSLGRAPVPSLSSTRLFQWPYLPIQQLKGGDEAVLTELVEQQLGTPGGRFPAPLAIKPVPQAPDLAAAPQLRDYARARQLINGQKLAEARKVMDQLTDRQLRQRAELFLAVAQPETGRKAGLEALTFNSTNVALARLANGLEVPAGFVPTERDDQAHWLFTEAPAPSDFLQRGLGAREIGRRLLGLESPAIHRRCVTRAAQVGWRELEALCESSGLDAKRAEGRRLLLEGLKAGQEKRFPQSAVLLARAQALFPLNNEHLTLFLRSAHEAGNAPLLDQARELLLTRGFPPQALEPLLTAGSESAPPPEPEAP